MGLWKRIRDWFRGSDDQVAEQALREREKPQGEDGLPPHFEEVVQPRQYPPTGP